MGPGLVLSGVPELGITGLNQQTSVQHLPSGIREASRRRSGGLQTSILGDKSGAIRVADRGRHTVVGVTSTCPV